MEISNLSPLGSWFVAASTGAISAWVLNYIREIWNRPKLQLAIDTDGGSVVETETAQNDQMRYARLIVRNRGRTLAKNCRASIDYIRRSDPSGSQYAFRTDLIDLKWSLLEQSATLFHVPSGGYRMLDVGYTRISASQFAAGNLHSSIFWIDGAIIPNRLAPELKMNAAYEMHIRAYADNASPAEFSCRVVVGPTFRDLTFVSCDDPRPRELR
jgi:hypothetical protein